MNIVIILTTAITIQVLFCCYFFKKAQELSPKYSFELYLIVTIWFGVGLAVLTNILIK